MARIEDLTSSGVSANLTAELARRFSPKTICEHIEKLLSAEVGAKVAKDGTVTPGRPDAISVSSGLRLLMGYLVGEPIKRVAMADVTPQESDEDTLKRLAASPSARAAAAQFLAGFDKKEPESLEMEVSQDDQGNDTNPA